MTEICLKNINADFCFKNVCIKSYEYWSIWLDGWSTHIFMHFIYTKLKYIIHAIIHLYS